MGTIAFPKPSWLETDKFASTCIIGGQWGDEAKGKIVYTLAEHHDIIMRYNGGPNAGHTLDNITLHQIPSGILYEDKINIMGQGMVINPTLFKREMEEVKTMPYVGHLVVSPNAHVILKHEIALDLGGAKQMVGTTGKGIGPTYEQRAARTGIRVADLADRKTLADKVRKSVESVNRRLQKESWVSVDEVIKEAEEEGGFLADYMDDATRLLKGAKKEGKKVLFEGAQGALLDVDNGTWPNVTSSNTTRPSVGQTGYYLPVTKALGVFKAPMSRVGKGPFPSEWGRTDGTNETRHLIEDEKEFIEAMGFISSGRMPDAGKEIVKIGRDAMMSAILEKMNAGKATDMEKAAYFGWKGMEFGATTGRARRLGPLDLVLARRVTDINGLDGAIFTKWDVYSGTGEVEFVEGYCLNDASYPFDYSGEYLSEMEFLNLRAADPMIKKLPGWTQDIRGMTEWDQLPKNTKSAIKFAEKAIGVPCMYFSTGPKKDEIIVRMKAK